MLEIVKHIAREAGSIVMKYYDGNIEVITKADNSPVTAADIAASTFILEELAGHFPGVWALSEESVDDPIRMQRDELFCIDPIDGTRDFINQTGDFAVIIGYLKAGQPTLGVVYLPARDELYFAEKGKGAWKQTGLARPVRIAVRKEAEQKKLRAAVSRFHSNKIYQQILDAATVVECKKIGSIGLKLAALAEGDIDLFINTSAKANDWDTGGPQIILEEAGGRITDLFGNPLSYNQPDVRHLHGVLATNGVVHEAMVDVIKKLGVVV